MASGAVMPGLSCRGLAQQTSREEDQQHVSFRGRVLGLYGKKPEIQLCNQADCGTGSSLKSDISVPQRLIAALALIWQIWRSELGGEECCKYS